jgi:hypothetical protein
MAILFLPMRRFLLICLALLALALPAAALAARDGDGTLAVRNAVGDPGQVVVWLNISGAVIGQVDSGRVLVDDLSLSGDVAPVVTGAERTRDLPSGATVYSGTGIRFRAVGGHYKLRILGRGIDVNVVGQGTVRLTGSATLAADGRYSLNGGPWTSLPDFGELLRIAAG